MEYITGRSTTDSSSDSYHFKLTYPDDYKSNDTRIVKFERNYFQFLEYRFVGLFPLSLSSTKVSYNNSQVLKATAQFSFDRYICGESSSLSRDLGRAFNNISTRITEFNKKDATGDEYQTTLSDVYKSDRLLNGNAPYITASGKTSSRNVTSLSGQSLGSGTSNTFNV